MQAAVLPKLAKCHNVADCIDMLHRMGAETIGYGYYAHVLKIDVMVGPELPPVGYVPDEAFNTSKGAVKRETRVIKVARNDVGGLVAARAAVMTSDIDPYAPKYHGFRALNFGYDWIGELELLEHTDQHLYRMGGHGDETIHITGQQFQRHPCKAFMDSSPYLRECVQQFRHERFEDPIAWDIHGANIMMRGDQPVITDPISCL